jgi:oligoribonuclease NrnB/cAMP/cGMP phosphodiesterase (DHH superfamily)
MGAAWAVWHAALGFTFYPGVYNEEPPWSLIENASEVLLVDFSYKRAVMEEICNRNQKVTVLDHHKTAEADIRPLLETGKVLGEFDMDRSGALIAWNWFHGFCDPPLMLKNIDLVDRYQQGRDTRASAALRSFPHDLSHHHKGAEWCDLMEVWDYLMNDAHYEKLRQEGEPILRDYRQKVNAILPNATTMNIGGYKNVPVVNAPYAFASALANELAYSSKDGIAASWFVNDKSKVVFSMRTAGWSDVDVSAIAVLYGGGGHHKAAGFELPNLETLVNLFIKEDRG